MLVCLPTDYPRADRPGACCLCGLRLLDDGDCPLGHPHREAIEHARRLLAALRPLFVNTYPDLVQ